MTTERFTKAATIYGSALERFVQNCPDPEAQILLDAVDEWTALGELLADPSAQVIAGYTDMVEAWEQFAVIESEQAIMDAVQGKPIRSRQQTLLQERLKPAEEKSNRESFIGDYTDVSEVNAEDPNSVPDIETISYSDLMGTKFDELWQPVEGLITEGLTVLVGGSKLGKSWICMDMAYCVATGTPYWGHKTTSCPVLYLALEDSQRRLQSRNTKLKHLVQNVQGLEYATKCRTMDNGFEQQISSWLEKHGGRCLVIIDVLQRIKGANKWKDGDAYQADYRNIGNIKAIADRFGAAFVVVHHTNKSRGSEDKFDRISGSSGIMGVADTVIMITRERKEQTAEVDITGRDVYGDTFTIGIDEDMHWNVVDTTFADVVNYKYDPVMLTVKAILKENPDGLKIIPKDFIQFGTVEMGYPPAKDGKDLRAKLLRLKDEASNRDGIKIILPEKTSRATKFYKRHGEDVCRSREDAQNCIELVRLQLPAKEPEQLELDQC